MMNELYGPHYEYLAKIERVIDGDTVYALLSPGLYIYRRESLRLFGVDTPELFTGTNREAGAASKAFTQTWVDTAAGDAFLQGMEWPFWIKTYQDKTTFGRFVAEIRRRDTGESLADALVAAGHAVRV